MVTGVIKTIYLQHLNCPFSHENKWHLSIVNAYISYTNGCAMLLALMFMPVGLRYFNIERMNDRFSNSTLLLQFQIFYSSRNTDHANSGCFLVTT